MQSDGSFSIGSETWPGVSKLIEEMGELQQVLGKLIATHGGTTHWDGPDLLDRLHDEMGDVLGALTFVTNANGLDEERLWKRAVEKSELFHVWHEAGDPPPVAAS